MSNFVECLVQVSEKAANIARVCRQNVHLFKLLVEEKKNEEKNSRFLQDFKTLADVLIQEMVKHDIGKLFPAISSHIRGEESNTFSNTIGESVTVRIESDEENTAKLLCQVLNGDEDAANLLAAEVHRQISIDQVNIGEQIIPQIGSLEQLVKDFGIWIDPIDSTAEYISGESTTCDSNSDVHRTGLKCVTVLIGVFERASGIPVIGIVNQPFYECVDLTWHGKCHWGIHLGDVHISSIPRLNPRESEKKVIALSSSEDPSLKKRLCAAGYHLLETAGAGYKLLCVAEGQVDAYLLSKATTYRWDTCAPHAILISLGGGIINYANSLGQGDLSDLSYKEEEGSKVWCNIGGIMAYRDETLVKELIKLLGDN